jgi:hypothetical protein
MIKRATLFMITLLCVFTIMLVTNCSKKSNDQVSKSNLKTDTVPGLPPQDSLALIKSVFGEGILNHLQTFYGSTIKDFRVLSDTLSYSGDTIALYHTVLSFQGFSYKELGIRIPVPTKKSTCYIVPYSTSTCTQGSCDCNCCSLINNGSWWSCLCHMYGDCQVHVAYHIIIIGWGK